MQVITLYLTLSLLFSSSIVRFSQQHGLLSSKAGLLLGNIHGHVIMTCLGLSGASGSRSDGRTHTMICLHGSCSRAASSICHCMVKVKTTEKNFKNSETGKVTAEHVVDKLWRPTLDSFKIFVIATFSYKQTRYNYI